MRQTWTIVLTLAIGALYGVLGALLYAQLIFSIVVGGDLLRRLPEWAGPVLGLGLLTAFVVLFAVLAMRVHRAWIRIPPLQRFSVRPLLVRRAFAITAVCMLAFGILIPNRRVRIGMESGLAIRGIGFPFLVRFSGYDRHDPYAVRDAATATRLQRACERDGGQFTDGENRGIHAAGQCTYDQALSLWNLFYNIIVWFLFGALVAGTWTARALRHRHDLLVS